MSKRNPKWYVIYCEEIGRKLGLQQELKDNGVDATLWRGMHGKTWGLKTSRPSNHYPDGTPWYMSDGQVSLVANHVALWQHCLVNGYEDVVILEDDAKFTDGWREKYEHVLETLPSDYDICYLGWIDRHPRGKVSFKGSKVLYHQITGGCLFGTHALLISKSGLRKLFETNQGLYSHIDIQIDRRTIPQCNRFACYPSLFKQKSILGEMEHSLGDNGMPAQYNAIQGWFDFQSIYDRVAQTIIQDNDTIIEVGSWLGKSSIYFALRLKAYGKHKAKIQCVDVWNDNTGDAIVDGVAKDRDVFQEFKDNVESCGASDMITPCRMTSVEAAKLVPDESAKFIFIDALHTYEALKEDITVWLPKLKKGCYIGGHDTDRDGVKRALNELLTGWYPEAPRSWLYYKK